MSPLPLLPPCCRTVRARRKSNLVDVLAALQQRPNEADIERWDVTLSFDTLKSALHCQGWISGSCSLCMQLDEERQWSSQHEGPW